MKLQFIEVMLRTTNFIVIYKQMFFNQSVRLRRKPYFSVLELYPSPSLGTVGKKSCCDLFSDSYKSMLNTKRDQTPPFYNGVRQRSRS